MDVEFEFVLVHRRWKHDRGPDSTVPTNDTWANCVYCCRHSRDFVWISNGLGLYFSATMQVWSSATTTRSCYQALCHRAAAHRPDRCMLTEVNRVYALRIVCCASDPSLHRTQIVKSPTTLHWTVVVVVEGDRHSLYHRAHQIGIQSVMRKKIRKLLLWIKLKSVTHFLRSNCFLFQWGQHHVQ